MTKKAEASGVEFCYFPNCRVLKELRSKPIAFSDEVTTLFDEKWVTLDDVKTSLIHGEVDFSKSNKPYEKGKLYIIEGRTITNQNIIIKLINYDNKVILDEIIRD
ncbi:DUF4258 domain-containing protein [uncultured Flavobacterium sp.]|uniref:DUF4258 domain-containing protein n=1 Tax=uncultured Flavobacterium sp. TaxID=165435 RepID=UPI0030CA1AE2|tara:strand:- start:29 stop:343 length:315 start_codon:yes stop_codon:yes gene_type:complete